MVWGSLSARPWTDAVEDQAALEATAGEGLPPRRICLIVRISAGLH